MADTVIVDGSFHLLVLNAAAFPDVLFAASPGLPPCGSNTESSRSWVYISSPEGENLYGYCALAGATEFGSSMYLPGGLAPSGLKAVHIVVNDRLCGTTVRSNDAPLPGR